MSFNLIEAAKGYLTNTLVTKASSMLGESPQNTQTALAGAIPMLLSGLINRAESPGGGNMLTSLLSQFTGAGATLPDPDAVDDDKAESMMSQGSGLIGSLFGDKGSMISSALAQFSGVKSSSASGLMGIAGTVLMGFLGRQATSGNLGEGGLMGLLTDQKRFVQNAMPAGLGSLLGNIPGIGGMMGGLSGLGAGLSGAGASMTGAASSAMSSVSERVGDAMGGVGGAVGYDNDRGSAGGGLGKLLPWLLLGLGALALFFMLRGCNGQKATTAVTDAASDAASSVGAAADSASSMASDAASSVGDVASDAAGAVGDAAASLGAFGKRKLSSGIELNIPANGIESKIIAFIEDANKPVDKTTWFNFDRLLFETGSSRLTASSQEQVRNMAEILKAYPAVNLKLGGYTDNTGNANGNKKLSGDRANAVMSALTNLGISADRLAAEGYGQEFPVAPNDTPEGRAQNRRIAVRVTKK